MKNKKLLVLTIALLATSCSSIVRHPEVDHVKKVAIISVTTNRLFIDKDASPHSMSFNPLGVVAGLGSQTDQAPAENAQDSDNRVRLATYVLDKYTEAFQKVPGWQVVSADTLLASPEYADLVSKDNSVRNVASLGRAFAGALYATPRKMGGITMNSQDMYDDKTEILKAMCKKYGLDAVITIDALIGFRRGFLNVGGAGLANVYITASPQMMNAQGQMAIKFPEGRHGVWYEGDRQVGMILGDLPPSRELELSLHKAIDRASHHALTTILEGLQP